MSMIRKILRLLQPEDRGKALILLGMIAVNAFLETFGVALIMPLIAVINDPGIVHEQRALLFLYELVGSPSQRSLLLFLCPCWLSLLVLMPTLLFLVLFSFHHIAHLLFFSLRLRLHTWSSHLFF